jgi:site-specific DNA-methyltransferase (adenine-specific)
MPKIELLHEDCMAVMSHYPDNYFELAIVDPPYGMKALGAVDGGIGGKLKDRTFKNGSIDEWDNAPDSSYFEELKRVSKNRIIWGGNYFDLPPSRCVICWDKCQPWENFSQWEMAWTSFGGVAPLFKLDNRTGGKIHPTQKPVKLYEWLLSKFAKEGDKILDTHGGSMSSAIAAHYGGFDMVLCELGKDYYEAGCKRFDNETSQIDMF